MGDHAVLFKELAGALYRGHTEAERARLLLGDVALYYDATVAAAEADSREVVPQASEEEGACSST